MALIQTFPPKDDESGFGYYRRLASDNALWGWRELAGLANVSRHRTGILGRPQHVAIALGLEAAWTQAAFQHEEISRRWRGLHRSTNDAICPDCLRDEVYIRDFWEHVYVTACPIHHVHLVDRCPACGDLLSQNRERIEQCPCGNDLRTATGTAATSCQMWLSTLLASDGLSTGGIQPKLHHVDTAALCELVGVLCLYADPLAPPPRRNAANPKSIREAIELLTPLDTLLVDWPTGFEVHVHERIVSGEKDARTLNKLLGRWYVDIKKVCSGNSLETFLEAVIRVASDSFDGALGLDTAKGIATKVSGHVPLTNAAKAIGVGRDRLLKAARAGECVYRTRRFGTRGVTYEIPQSEVERICAQRAVWISEAQASEQAQVPRSVLQNMVAAKVVISDAKWRNDILKGAAIEMTSIRALSERINQLVAPRRGQGGEVVTWAELTSRRMGDKQAIQSAMQAAASGELVAVVSGRQLGQVGFLMSDVMAYFGTPVLEAGLVVNRLSKLTGWKWESISHWIELGLLESQSIVLRGQACRVVSPEQLLSFTRTYIPLSDLAKGIDSRPSFLIENLSGLEVLGGKPLPNGSQRGALVRLADLARLALDACRT